mmetsp:Transcript_118338/g.204564  ORF Transcript_118338/g.204564 Transcript_118338/m.204564 type:complete len:331 (+) Transcript_118338:23-1015(+)
MVRVTSSEAKASSAAAGPSVGSLLQALAKERSKGLVLDLRTGAIVQKSTPAKVRTSGDDDPSAEVAPISTSPVPKTALRRPAQPDSHAAVPEEADDVSESSESSTAGEVVEEEEADEISEEAPRSSIPRSETPSSQSLDPETRFDPEVAASKGRLRSHRTVTLVPASSTAAGGGASNALDSRSSAKDHRRRRESGAGVETEVRLLSRKDLERAASRSSQPGRQSPARWRPSHPGDQDCSEDDSASMDSETAPAAGPGDDSSSSEEEPQEPQGRAGGSKRRHGRIRDALDEIWRDRQSARTRPVNEELAMPVARDMQKAEDREAVKAKKEG